MKSPKSSKKQIGMTASDEEIAVFDWLAKETSRSRSGAIKWAAEKVAKEMGYLPKISKK